MSEQTWKTLDELAGTLRLPKSYIKTLASQGVLAYIGNADKRRYLDPTAEYKEKLRLAAILHGKIAYVPPDISERHLISLREIAEICGWAPRTARNYMAKHKDIPRLRISPILTLYKVQTLRHILWDRENRKLSKQLAPFLLKDILGWFRKQYAQQSADIPTDAEYLADEVVIRKLEAIVRKADKEQILAKADLARKVALAQKVLQILDSVPKP